MARCLRRRARLGSRRRLKTGTPIRVAEVKGNMLVVEEL